MNQYLCLNLFYSKKLKLNPFWAIFNNIYKCYYLLGLAMHKQH